MYRQWGLDHKEGWALKKWFFQTVVLKKTHESPLNSKEIKPVNPKGNQHWIFIGRTDAEAEAPIFQPPDAKSQLIGKHPDAGKDWRQEEKVMTESEMVRWLTDSMDMELRKLREIVKDRETWSAAVHGTAESWTRLRDWRRTAKTIWRCAVKHLTDTSSVQPLSRVPDIQTHAVSKSKDSNFPVVILHARAHIQVDFCMWGFSKVHAFSGCSLDEKHTVCPSANLEDTQLLNEP